MLKYAKDLFEITQEEWLARNEELKFIKKNLLNGELKKKYYSEVLTV